MCVCVCVRVKEGDKHLGGNIVNIQHDTLANGYRLSTL